MIFGQSELDINYDTIKVKIQNPLSDTYYPKLLKRFNEFDSTLTLHDYSLIYYGFSFQPEYIKSKPSEDHLNDLLKTNDYKKISATCKQILNKNPVSLLANDKMGHALFKLKRPESEWKNYQIRYRMLRKVIVFSGSGLTCKTSFKIIYVSDEYNILYDYFEIPKIHKQTLIGLCDKFDIVHNEYYQAKEIYFDTSRELTRRQQILHDN